MSAARDMLPRSRSTTNASMHRRCTSTDRPPIGDLGGSCHQKELSYTGLPATSSTTRFPKSHGCGDAARRIGRLLEDQSATLDEQFQAVFIQRVEESLDSVIRDRTMVLRLRLDDSLDGLRNELEQLRSELTSDFTQMLSKTQAQIITEVKSGVEELRVKVQVQESGFSTVRAEMRQTLAHQTCETEKLREDLKCSVNEDISSCCATLEKLQRQFHDAENSCAVLRHEVNACTEIALAQQRETAELRGTISHEFQATSEALAVLHAALERQSTECLGQLGAMWVCLERNAGSSLQHGDEPIAALTAAHQLKQHPNSHRQPVSNNAPVDIEAQSRHSCLDRDRASLTELVTCSTVTSDVDASNSHCENQELADVGATSEVEPQIGQQVINSSCGHTKRPPRPADILSPSRCSQSQPMGKCSDVDACSL